MLALVLTAAGCSAGHALAPDVPLSVHLGLFGGPVTPNGRMALSDAPQPGAPITVTASDGTRRTADTDSAGIARFALPPGTYVVHSPTCGVGGQRVAITEGHEARVRLRCDVP